MAGKNVNVLLLGTFVMVFCEVILNTNAQQAEFTVQPVNSLDLTPSEISLAQLECSYTKQSADDVIGWVVNGVRITDKGTVDSNAANQVLGQNADTILQPSSESGGTGPSFEFTYGLDFFGVTPVVAGDYQCQLCSDDGSGGCGTVLAESDISEVRVEYEPTTDLVCLPQSSTTSRVVLGESLTLSCASDPGLPVVQLEWLRNSEVIADQPVPIQMNGILYNNFSFTPVATDTGVQLTCRRRAQSGNEANCRSPTLNVVSTPDVYVYPPDPREVPVGNEAVYTCEATSATDTRIASYSWTVPEIDASRYTIAGNILTIAEITLEDHGKVIECQATDAEGMTGTGDNMILVEGEILPSNIPTLPPKITTATSEPGPESTTSPPPGGITTAAIIIISIVAVILLCIFLGGLWFFCKKRKQKQQKHIPPTVVKNNLSPTSATALNSDKTFTYPPNNSDPDVIPKGMNERPVDVKDQWRDSGPPDEYSPTIKSVNMPFQNQGSKMALDDYNYNPTYDDKVDPADLDYKPPLDDRDYSDSGYRDGDNLYPDEKYGKGYEDRQYGDGHQDPYAQDYDPYGDRGDYGRVYNDDYQSQPPHYGSGYDSYPDRNPDGSEGYDPAPEEYNAQPVDSYNAQPIDGYNDNQDYSHVSDYGVPAEYNQPDDYGYDAQPGGYDDKPANYDYQGDYQHSDYPPQPNDYDQQSYHAAPYDDQYNQPAYNDSHYPDRVPDGGAPENDGYDYNYNPESNEPYNDGGYGDYGPQYDDGANYSAHPAEHDSYAPSYQESYHSPGQSHHSEPYLQLEDEVSATSNPSYV